MAATKRKLLFEYYRNDDSFDPDYDGSFARKVEKLKENKVTTVFIITSEEISLEPYLKLIKRYEQNGFAVKSINIEALDDEHLPFVKNAVQDINLSFKSGSCLIVSFGKSVAGPVLACFYIYSGKNLKDVLEKVQSINENLMRKEEETAFVRNFQRYIGNGGMDDAKPVASEEELVLAGEKLQDRKQEEVLKIYEQSDKDAIKPAKKEEDKSAEGLSEQKDIRANRKEGEKADLQKEKEIEVDYEKMPEIKGGFGRFYSSIRFKLISITSLIIIISFSGMILLAAYFFKKDNTIRVQENNLYVSEVIAIKVKADFQAVIDKSKLIANALMQNIGGKDLDYYSNLILSNDKDFVFFGIAVPSKDKTKLNFIKSVHNNTLMSESQIAKKDIEAIHNSDGSVFNESFSGENVVVHNISRGFNTPAMGLSLPFHKDVKGGIQSILICYVKLDRFLQAFQSTGITKTFMVNGMGDILAHSDNRIVLGGGNYIKIPIVKLMVKSNQQNGQQRYSDENGQYHLGSFHKIGISGCGVIATVMEDVAYQEVYNQQRRNIYLTIIVLTAVILFIYFFGKTLTTPIIRLLGATKKIKNGDYNVKIRPAYRDEIGELTNAFVEMGQGLEEREKIKTTFGKFVNPELANMLMKKEVKLGGERKTGAIMFSDIRNFTSMSERLQPEEVVDYLNHYLSRMVACIDKTGGIVDKFIGDAIMAEWGILVTGENDTENAINAALMMRKELVEFNNSRKDNSIPEIKMGCGINTGPVLAGQIGSEQRMEFTVIGDAVNLASRIESLNKPFGTDILISQDSYEIVKDIFAMEKMSPIKVKGKEEPQQIYAVLGRLDDPGCIKGAEELRKILGTELQPFNRREEDKESFEKQSKDIKHDITEEEVKYEILAK